MMTMPLHVLMKKKVAAATLAAVCGLAASSASLAQIEGPPVQPGLWQYKVKLTSQSGQIESALSRAQAQLAKLPPEQRQAIERMMAAKGVSMDAANNTAIKVCLTKEDAERGSIPINLQKGNCTQQKVSSEGNTTKVSFSCESDPPVSGTGEFTVLSPTSVTSKALVDTVVKGQPEKLDLAQEGTWLAADCGGIAPLGR
jgi:hypothetical protein